MSGRAGVSQIAVVEIVARTDAKARARVSFLRSAAAAGCEPAVGGNKRQHKGSEHGHLDLNILLHHPPSHARAGPCGFYARRPSRTGRFRGPSIHFPSDRSDGVLEGDVSIHGISVLGAAISFTDKAQARLRHYRWRSRQKGQLLAPLSGNENESRDVCRSSRNRGQSAFPKPSRITEAFPRHCEDGLSNRQRPPFGRADSPSRTVPFWDGRSHSLSSATSDP